MNPPPLPGICGSGGKAQSRPGGRNFVYLGFFRALQPPIALQEQMRVAQSWYVCIDGQLVSVERQMHDADAAAEATGMTVRHVSRILAGHQRKIR